MPNYEAGIWVWSPPPAAALWALEELRQARQKRQDSAHIILIPKLMVQEWRRQLYKAADLIVEIPLGHPYWPDTNHEPLTFALCFPYINREPWELKGTPLMGRMGKMLRDLFQTNSCSERHILSQFCRLPSRMEYMSLCQLRKVLRGSWEPRVPSQSSSE